MDEYLQIGPEKGDYDRDVQAVADALQFAERAVTVAVTHRMTRQQITVALKSGMTVITPPPGTREGDKWVFLAVDGKGAYWFRGDLLIDSGYMASKLGINPVDAETLCDFVARLATVLWGVEPAVGHSTVTVL